jgi:Fic family protein
VQWFLKVCLDQVQFMSGLFNLNELKQRLRTLVERTSSLNPQAAALLEEALMRGEFERGEVTRITGLPERTARRVLADVTELGLLASATPKGPVSLRLPKSVLEELFPRLYPQI